MIIQKVSGFQPIYTGIEQTKRGEPVKEPNMAKASDLIEHKIEKQEWKDKFKYDWKTISAITGGVALILLGVMKRHAIKGLVNKVFKSDPVKKNA